MVEGSNPSEPVKLFPSGGNYLKKFSVLDHEMVPEHIVLSEGEVKTLLAKYNMAKGQLPKIKTSDPVCREINAKAGDVVKVVRDSPIAGKAVAYRLVIEG